MDKVDCFFAGIWTGMFIIFLAVALSSCTMEPVEFQNYNIVTGWEETE